jgi:Ca2+-binding RTX toxin-like protein
MAGRLAAAVALAAVACLFVGAASSAAGTRDSSCFGRRVTIWGTHGDDEIRGTPDDDVIRGLGGDDMIWGRGGNDRLCGGLGDDRVFGNTWSDWVKGGPGSDRARGGRHKDFIIVFDYQAGNDWADGGPGRHDGCSVDAGYRPDAGDKYTGDCEDVVGAAGGGGVIRR